MQAREVGERVQNSEQTELDHRRSDPKSALIEYIGMQRFPKKSVS